jgi:hypothetical protein
MLLPQWKKNWETDSTCLTWNGCDRWEHMRILVGRSWCSPAKYQFVQFEGIKKVKVLRMEKY